MLFLLGVDKGRLSTTDHSFNDQAFGNYDIIYFLSIVQTEAVIHDENFG